VVIGGVLAVVIVSWVVGIVLGTIAMAVRFAVLAAIVWGVFRVWAIFSRD
jgi:hypothetical protein